MVHWFNKKTTPQKTFLQNVIEFICIVFLIFSIRIFIFGLYIVPTGSMEPTMLVGARFFADKLSYFLRKPARKDIIAFNDPEFRYAKNKLVAMFQHYVWGPANWTKRVIGIPGDEVRGAIEGGKPVVYLNGEKLDEPYINPYPLIHVWKKSIDQIQKEVQRELQKYAHINRGNQAVLNNLITRKLSEYSTWKTYDPSVSFEDQPFYQLSEQRVDRDENGDLKLLYPETPFYKSDHKKEKGRGKGEFWNGSDEFYVKLRDGEYWCMGDNRRGSKDCRVFGPIKETFIHGRILFQIFSIDNDDSWSTWLLIDLLLHPIEFFRRIRWHDLWKWVQ